MIKLGINAILLFVRELDKCTVFYRDVLKLPFVGSDPGVATFKVQDRYLTLQSPEGVAKLFGIEPDAVNIEGNPRAMIASRVEDVLRPMKPSKQRVFPSSAPPPIILGGYALPYLSIPKATSGISTKI